jgi:hypothetical protein
VGLALLFWLINMGAAFAGYIACCIGIWFTMPIVMLWWHATVLYLYRSWSGRPGPWRVESEAPAAPPPALALPVAVPPRAGPACRGSAHE